MYQLKKGMKDPNPKQCSGEERRQKSSAESRWITNYRELVLTSIQKLYDGETTGPKWKGGGDYSLRYYVTSRKLYRGGYFLSE